MDQESSSMPPTAIVKTDKFREHNPGRLHPDSPLRYDAVMNALSDNWFDGKVERLPARPATDADLMRCHSPDYVQKAERGIRSGHGVVSTGGDTGDGDSWAAALHAVGAVCLAVDLVVQGKAKNAFCPVRPAGHHATVNCGMGFCVFNNVAIAARYAQQQHGVGKILIVDWDVHHGNGTQEIFYEDPSVYFFSTHQWPWYPGTGKRDETGHGRGLGTTMNRPFAAGAGRREIVGTFIDDLEPAMERFRPEMVLISAGFDSRESDPLGEFRLTDVDFEDLTRIVLEVASQFAHGRVLSVLEGGYSLTGLASAVAAHCRVLASWP